MDPWRIIELLVIAFIGLGWRTLDTRITDLKTTVAEQRTKIHNLEGQTAMLATANARSEERDKAFSDTMDRLAKALDRFDTKVDELSRIVGVARKMSPEPFKSPIRREE